MSGWDGVRSNNAHPATPGGDGHGGGDDHGGAAAGGDARRTGSRAVAAMQTAPAAAPVSKAWMVTFTDLVSLMLTFFVMMFSMSSVKVDQWQEMIDALSQSLSPTRETEVATPKAQYNVSTVFRRRAINLDYLEAVLLTKLAADPLLSRSHMQLLEDRLVISLPGDLLFETGSAVLSESAQTALFELGGVLRSVNNQLAVAGHSDPDPIMGGTYASNWELSLARGVAVANALRRAGYTDDILAYGYSDSRFDVLPDIPREERYRLSRRVDVMVLATGGAP